MKLNYTPEAIADLDNIHSYIAEDDSNAADRVVARILQSMAQLEILGYSASASAVSEKDKVLAEIEGLIQTLNDSSSMSLA